MQLLSDVGVKAHALAEVAQHLGLAGGCVQAARRHLLAQQPPVGLLLHVCLDARRLLAAQAHDGAQVDRVALQSVGERAILLQALLQKHPGERVCVCGGGGGRVAYGAASVHGPGQDAGERALVASQQSRVEGSPWIARKSPDS